MENCLKEIIQFKLKRNGLKLIPFPVGLHFLGTLIDTIQPSKHVKCRREYPQYPAVKRTVVEDDKIDWDVEFKDYNPPTFPSVETIIFDDVSDHSDVKNIDFTAKDRKSLHGPLKIDSDGYPLNPFGRTGLKGLGSLYRYGVNQTTRVIIFRIVDEKFQFLLYFNNGEWGLPNGFLCEDMVITSEKGREFISKNLHFLGHGYVDDARNTDNAWIESIVGVVFDNDYVFCDEPVYETIRWVELNESIEVCNDQKFARKYEDIWLPDEIEKRKFAFSNLF
jgi:ADP-ribose pyrophosphatase